MSSCGMSHSCSNFPIPVFPEGASLLALDKHLLKGQKVQAERAVREGKTRPRGLEGTEASHAKTKIRAPHQTAATPAITNCMHNKAT